MIVPKHNNCYLPKNCSTTAGRPSTAAHSRTAAGIGSGCCSSAVPGAGHSHADASAAAVASTVLWRLLFLGSVVVPAWATMIQIDCFAWPQWDSRLDYVVLATTTNGLGSFGIAVPAVASVVVVPVIAAAQVIARKYCWREGKESKHEYIRIIVS